MRDPKRVSAVPGMTHLSRIVPIVALSAAAACSGETNTDGHLVEQRRVVMGTELRLAVWNESEDEASEAFGPVFQEFERLDALMSVWRSGSDLQRLNAAAGGDPIPVSPEVIDALLAAREISVLTGGKFDVTFGALAGLWKFDHDRDERIPPRQAILERLPLVDYRLLAIDARRRTARLERKGMQAHLGGIGKGFAIDRAVGLLRERGVSDFLIQAGGDLYVSGEHGGRVWNVGIQDPRGAAENSFAMLSLSDAAVSTSGDYERYFIEEDRRYHHIIDPDLGEPSRGSRSVTIVAPSSTLADGLSTGVFLLGPAAGMALIERLPVVEGVIVTESNEVLVSSGLKDRLTLLAAPTDAP